MELMIVTGMALAILIYLRVFAWRIAPKTGALIDFLGKEHRSVGPGLVILSPFESITGEVSLANRLSTFSDDFETRGDEEVSLTIAFEWHALPERLWNLWGFGDGTAESAFQKIEAAVKERLKSIIAVRVHKEADREAVLKKLKPIAEDIKAAFETAKTEDDLMTLQDYYGVNLSTLSFSGVALSPEVKAAAARMDAQKRENQIRQLKLKKTRDMAAQLVAKSKKDNPGDPKKWLSMEKALEIVQIDEKTVPKEIVQFELGRNAAEGDALTKGLSMILGGIFGRSGRNKGGRHGR